MKILIDLIMLDRLDQLIRLHATGAPKNLAARLGISLTTLNEMIWYMRNILKASIRYNRYEQSYYYVFVPDFYLGFEKDRSQPVNV